MSDEQTLDSSIDKPLLITDRCTVLQWVIGDEWIISFSVRERAFRAVWGEDYRTRSFPSFDEAWAEARRLNETGEHLR